MSSDVTAGSCPYHIGLACGETDPWFCDKCGWRDNVSERRRRGLRIRAVNGTLRNAAVRKLEIARMGWK